MRRVQIFEFQVQVGLMDQLVVVNYHIEFKRNTKGERETFQKYRQNSEGEQRAPYEVFHMMFHCMVKDRKKVNCSRRGAG